MGKKRDAKKARRRSKQQKVPTSATFNIDMTTGKMRTVADQARIVRKRPSAAEMARLFGEGRVIFGIDPSGLSGKRAGLIIGDGITTDPPFRAPKPPRPKLPPEITALLDVPKPAKRSSLIPPTARSARYEDVHEWLPGTSRPVRSSYGFHMVDPPIAFVCPGCDHRQAPLGVTRTFFGEVKAATPCGYCGLTFVLHGTRVVWWR